MRQKTLIFNELMLSAMSTGIVSLSSPFLGLHEFEVTICDVVMVKVQIKQSRNRPGVAQRVPGGLGPQISWHSTLEGGEVVSLTHRSPLPPRMFLVLIFTRGWVDLRVTVQSEGNTPMKNPVTPPGIDPGNVRLVAQRLNHYATPGNMCDVVEGQSLNGSSPLCAKNITKNIKDIR